MSKDSARNFSKFSEKLRPPFQQYTHTEGRWGLLSLYTHAKRHDEPTRCLVRSGADAVDCSTNREPAGVSGASLQCLNRFYFHLLLHRSIVLFPFSGHGLQTSCDGLANVGLKHCWFTWSNKQQVFPTSLLAWAISSRTMGPLFGALTP